MTHWENTFNKYTTKLQPTEEDKADLLVSITEWFIAHDQGDRVRFARLHNECIWNVNPKDPWIYLQNNERVEKDTLCQVIPHFEEVKNFDLYTGEAKLNRKDIRWNPSLQLWKYWNHRTVHFNKTPTKGTNLELASSSEADSDSDSDKDNDTAQVESILKRAETTLIKNLKKIVSRAGTPDPTESLQQKASPLPGKSKLQTEEVSQVPTPPISKGKQTAPAPPPPRTHSSSSSPRPLQTPLLSSTTKPKVQPPQARNTKGKALSSTAYSSAPTSSGPPGGNPPRPT